MRVFISEYVCSGAWLEPALRGSLAREGRAMLLSLLQDAARIEGWTIYTTWDRRLGRFSLSRRRRRRRRLTERKRSSVPAGGQRSDRTGAGGPDPAANIHVELADSPDHEAALFQKLAAECDATYVIAPELDDRLTSRCRMVRRAGGRCLNSTLGATQLCSDKWALWRQLTDANVPTIATWKLPNELAQPPFGYPYVLKPRFGAGSQSMYLVENGRARFAVGLLSYPMRTRKTRHMIAQPFVPGLPISVAAIHDDAGRLRELWPVALQVLSHDGEFRYVGGQIPQEVRCGEAIAELVRRASSLVPGLRGYVGFDLVIPDLNPYEPLLVEINPRLTTSYIGYRAGTSDNLAERVLRSEATRPEVTWRPGYTVFSPDGQTIAMQDSLQPMISSVIAGMSGR